VLLNVVFLFVGKIKWWWWCICVCEFVYLSVWAVLALLTFKSFDLETSFIVKHVHRRIPRLGSCKLHGLLRSSEII